MKPNQIMEAMGQIDDDLLAETDALRTSSRSKRKVWYRSPYFIGTAVAACFCLVIGLSLSNLRMGSSSSEDSMVAGESAASSVDQDFAGSVSNSSADAAVADVLLCKLSDFDAEIYVDHEISDTEEEMAFLDVLSLLSEQTDVIWRIAPDASLSEEEANDVIDQMLTYVAEEGYDHLFDSYIP